MSESGKRELEDLKKIVTAWKESYMRIGSQDCVMEFASEIEEMVYPYLRRLYECNYIDEPQLHDFLRFCNAQLVELQNYVSREEIYATEH